MNYYIIIPAHNEEAFLDKTLQSIARQTLPPKKTVVVNDNSTDGTEGIIDDFANRFSNLEKLTIRSSSEHMPGSKVVNAFNKGLDLMDDGYDFLVKLDADVILPDDYFERIAHIFVTNPKVGITGGFAYEKDSHGQWRLHHPMNKNHVRGAFKAYSKACFVAINGLRNAMGWDTLDELLAQFHGFTIHTQDSLHVKHLRPTGHAYNKRAKQLQGHAMYTMGYGWVLTGIASLKMAWKQRKARILWDNLKGYVEAFRNTTPLLVSREEKRFIRALRWKNIGNRFLKIGHKKTV